MRLREIIHACSESRAEIRKCSYLHVRENLSRICDIVTPIHLLGSSYCLSFLSQPQMKEEEREYHTEIHKIKQKAFIKTDICWDMHSGKAFNVNIYSTFLNHGNMA